MPNVLQHVGSSNISDILLEEYFKRCFVLINQILT